MRAPSQNQHMLRIVPSPNVGVRNDQLKLCVHPPKPQHILGIAPSPKVGVRGDDMQFLFFGIQTNDLPLLRKSKKIKVAYHLRAVIAGFHESQAI